MDNYNHSFHTWDKLAEEYENKFMDLDLYNDTYDLFCQNTCLEKEKILSLKDLMSPQIWFSWLKKIYLPDIFGYWIAESFTYWKRYTMGLFVDFVYPICQKRMWKN